VGQINNHWAKRIDMKNMEQLELDAHRKDHITDMHGLLEKYQRIFGWNIPEINQQGADKLILAAMHKALDDIAL
jgi:hypothetical protein